MRRTNTDKVLAGMEKAKSAKQIALDVSRNAAKGVCTGIGNAFFLARRAAKAMIPHRYMELKRNREIETLFFGTTWMGTRITEGHVELAPRRERLMEEKSALRSMENAARIMKEECERQKSLIDRLETLDRQMTDKRSTQRNHNEDMGRDETPDQYMT